MVSLDLHTIYHRIMLKDECIAEIDNLIHCNSYRNYINKYYKNKYKLYDEIQARSDWRRWFLGFYCYMSQYAYENFKLRYSNTDENIFFETLKDITLLTESCKNQYGYWGIDKIKWISHVIDLNVFRLGRLEFRLRSLDKDYNVGDYFISKKGVVISVHIPSGDKLDYEECVKSFKQAYNFFNGTAPIVYCRSWLIDNRITPFLNSNSNILKFQRLFTVVEQEDNIFCEEFVFNGFSDDKSVYEENTSLQRELKRYLLNGGKLGTSKGFLFFDKNGEILMEKGNQII